MTAQLTKTGIEFDEFRVYRVSEGDPPTTEWHITVGYRVLTEEGETWTRDVTEKLAGPIKTKASGLLTAIRTIILQREGIT